MLPPSASAAIVFNVEEPAVYNSAGPNVFDITAESTGTDTVGSIDLRLLFDNFVGTLAGSTLNITSITGGGLFTVSPFGTDTTPAVVSSGDTLRTVLQSTGSPTTFTTTPSTIATVTFTGAGGLFPEGDFFDATVTTDTIISSNIGLRVPGQGLPETQTIGRITPVPEPGSVAVLGALAIGTVVAKRRRRHAKATASLG